MKDDKPLVTDELKPVEWKLSAPGVQKVLSASMSLLARRTGRSSPTRSRKMVCPVRGTLCPAFDWVKTSSDVIAVQDTCRRLWPEALGGANQVPVTVDFGASITEPAAKLQALVAAQPSLDGKSASMPEPPGIRSDRRTRTRGHSARPHSGRSEGTQPPRFRRCSRN